MRDNDEMDLARKASEAIVGRNIILFCLAWISFLCACVAYLILIFIEARDVRIALSGSFGLAAAFGIMKWSWKRASETAS